jgi:hypothetical protein
MIRSMLAVIVLITNLKSAADQLKPETVSAFDHYVQLSEQRMSQELNSGPFLRIDGLAPPEREGELRKLKNGEVIVDHLQTLDHGHSIPVPGGLIHHWVAPFSFPAQLWRKR